MNRSIINSNVFEWNKKKTAFLVLVFLGIFFFLGIAQAADCNGTMTMDQFKAYERSGDIGKDMFVSGSKVTAIYKNKTGCYVPVNLTSYKAFDNVIANQEFFATINGTVSPNSELRLTVNIPDCMSQSDMYYGHVIPYNPAQYYSGSYNYGAIMNDVGNYCINDPPPATLTGSCSVSPSSINTGGSLTWHATASGGTGSYAYSWTGTDSLFASGSSISKMYFSPGTKTGTVTITSGTQSVVRSCSAIVIEEEEDDDLFVSCSVSDSRVEIDEDVTWRATATGGDGDYDYDWDGTDDLSGSSRNLTWSYDDDGTKRGTVTVTSHGQTATASCSVRVEEEEEEDDDLSVSCYASPSNPQMGSRMNWYVRVSGGDGDYDYDWSGTDGLNSSSRSPSMTYDTPGSKRATVTVTDGDDQEDSDTCYVNINSVLAYSDSYQTPLASAVYLSEVPYTGIADNFKLYFFVLMLALFSAWMAYVVISWKRERGELN